MSLLEETRLRLGDLARRERVVASTVWRWTTCGVRGVRLETLVVGGTRHTTEEAFERFVAACTAARGGATAETRQEKPRTCRQRTAAIARAERELKRMGV